MTTWYCLDLKCPDTYLRPGEMVVVRLGSLSFREATYRVGCFDTDPTDPSAKKFYFFRSGGGIEDPDRCGGRRPLGGRLRQGAKKEPPSGWSQKAVQ